MKKDINIPESKDIYIAAVLEKHPEYHTKDWNAYIINDGQEPVEMALIVSKGLLLNIIKLVLAAGCGLAFLNACGSPPWKRGSN